MLPPRRVAAMTLFALSVSNVAVAVDAAPCAANDTAQLDKLADSMGGLLRYCQTDSGFTLYPFTAFPPSDKSSVICSGRSCPSAIYNFVQAKLPECTLPVQGKAMTPLEYLRALCPSNVPPSTTTPAPTGSNGATTTPTTTAPPTTTTPTTPGATTTTPTTTTSTPSATTTTPATTTATPPPSPSNRPGGQGSAASASSSSTDSASPSVTTPSASQAGNIPAKTPAKAPTTGPASSATHSFRTGLVSAASVVLVVAAVQIL